MTRFGESDILSLMQRGLNNSSIVKNMHNDCNCTYRVFGMIVPSSEDLERLNEFKVYIFKVIAKLWGSNL